MSGTPLELINSPRRQGASETRTHAFTLPTGITPSVVTFTVIKISDGSTHASGSGAIAGGVVTLAAISGLSAGQSYRVNVTMTVGAETLVRWFRLDGET